jgi:hypothetical protein
MLPVLDDEERELTAQEVAALCRLLVALSAGRSRFRGVRFEPSCGDVTRAIQGPWAARACGEYLGNFETEHEAAAAVDSFILMNAWAARSRLNFPHACTTPL